MVLVEELISLLKHYNPNAEVKLLDSGSIELSYIRVQMENIILMLILQ